MNIQVTLSPRAQLLQLVSSVCIECQRVVKLILNSYPVRIECGISKSFITCLFDAHTQCPLETSWPFIVRASFCVISRTFEAENTNAHSVTQSKRREISFDGGRTCSETVARRIAFLDVGFRFEKSALPPKIASSLSKLKHTPVTQLAFGADALSIYRPISQPVCPLENVCVKCNVRGARVACLTSPYAHELPREIRFPASLTLRSIHFVVTFLRESLSNYGRLHFARGLSEM